MPLAITFTHPITAPIQTLSLHDVDSNASTAGTICSAEMLGGDINTILLGCEDDCALCNAVDSFVNTSDTVIFDANSSIPHDTTIQLHQNGNNTSSYHRRN